MFVNKESSLFNLEHHWSLNIFLHWTCYTMSTGEGQTLSSPKHSSCGSFHSRRASLLFWRNEKQAQRQIPLIFAESPSRVAAGVLLQRLPTWKMIVLAHRWKMHARVNRCVYILVGWCPPNCHMTIWSMKGGIICHGPSRGVRYWSKKNSLYFGGFWRERYFDDILHILIMFRKLFCV